jgi:hypothetical protein
VLDQNAAARAERHAFDVSALAARSRIERPAAGARIRLADRFDRNGPRRNDVLLDKPGTTASSRTS